VCDFGRSAAVGRKVAQENFSSCHHTFVLGIEERKAKTKEYTNNRTRKRRKRAKIIIELGTRRDKNIEARRKGINDAGLNINNNNNNKRRRI
jgi:hypothetical protein